MMEIHQPKSNNQQSKICDAENEQKITYVVSKKRCNCKNIILAFLFLSFLSFANHVFASTNKEQHGESVKKRDDNKKSKMENDFLSMVQLIGDATKQIRKISDTPGSSTNDESEDESESEEGEDDKESSSSNDGSEKAPTSPPTELTKNDPVLRFCEDLTEKAREGMIDPVLGRDDEIERITEILARREKGNPILVGEAGVGKTAVVEGLALRIIEGSVPSNLQQRIILSVQVGSLIAGASFRGEFEKRFKLLMDRVQASKGKIIMFIDEIHMVMGAGKSDGPLDFANMLKPALARSGTKVIAATTLREYRKYIEPDPAFVRRFVPVTIAAPSVESTIIILEGGKTPYEDFHKVKIKHAAVVAAAKFSNEYIPDRQLPDKAFDLLDMACSSKLLALETQKLNDRRNKILRGERVTEKNSAFTEGIEIDENDIAIAVSKWTGIPVAKLEESERQRILRLSENLRKRVVGQDKAIDAVVDAVMRSFAGLTRGDQPVGSFLFLGSTGVGKTELSKALAEELWSDKRNHLVRIDMSEFQEAHSVSRLIGSPPGYAGNDEGGQLTEAVRQIPNSVVLFDEVERANKNIFDLFLQILGEGRLTDGRGKTVDFTKTIIIFTSNIGQSHIIESDAEARAQANEEVKGKGVNAIGGKKSKSQMRKPGGWKSKGKGDAARQTELQQKIMDDVKTYFKAEILNRLTQTVIFSPISEATLKLVLRKEVGAVSDLITDRGIDFGVNVNVEDFIITNAYSHKYGARPLKRFFAKHILAPLSKLLVNGDVPVHSCLNVVLGAKKNTLDLEVAAKNMQTRKCDMRKVKVIFLVKVPPSNPDDPDQAIWQ